MTPTLVLLLPAVVDPLAAACHWWHVTVDGIAERGSDERWRALAAALPLVVLAPVASVRLDLLEQEGTTERQQLGVARAKALAASMAEPATVHAVTGHVDGRLMAAVVANGQMMEWLDWLSAHGTDPAAIVPAGLLLPPSDEWLAASLGSERMIGRGDLILADEPALREVLVDEAEVAQLSDGEFAARLTMLAAFTPLNLRSGRFARQRLFVLDWARVRELAALAALIPLLGLVVLIATIVRLERDSDRLEAETARFASAALGQPVTAAAARSVLDSRIGAVPGASGSPFVPLTAVYQQLQQVPGANAAAMSWRPDGTLVLSLAATRTEDLNRVLLALQRAGYRVTATSRAGASGQVVADITVRTTA